MYGKKLAVYKVGSCAAVLITNQNYLRVIGLAVNEMDVYHEAVHQDIRLPEVTHGQSPVLNELTNRLIDKLNRCGCSSI